jgi:hypothetical protein
LTKIKSITSQDVEFSKVLGAILNNYKVTQFENTISETTKNDLYDLLNLFVTDIVQIHDSFANDLTIDIRLGDELEIIVNFIQSGQDLNNILFEKAIEYADKYEEIVANHSLTGLVYIDFTTMTRNENVHIITKYSDGLVVDDGEARK